MFYSRDQYTRPSAETTAPLSLKSPQSRSLKGEGGLDKVYNRDELRSYYSQWLTQGQMFYEAPG